MGEKKRCAFCGSTEDLSEAVDIGGVDEKGMRIDEKSGWICRKCEK